ncbi:MAG: hypothetical protein C0518_13690 [Opitutus sp.]|nr:hypothetical protein [Opitutus sp.]
MKTTFPELCLAIGIGGVALWLCWHPQAFTWLVMLLVGALLFAPYLVFLLALFGRPPPSPVISPDHIHTPPDATAPVPPKAAPPPDTVTPFLLGLIIGHWFGRGPHDGDDCARR